MPLYEFLRLAIEKLESSQQKQCSTDLSLETENDLVGGLTMNGENTTKEQTDKVTRSPILHGLPPDVPTPYGDATLGNSSTSRTEKFGGVEYIFNDISPPLDLSHKDATVPWLSFPVDDSQQDYSSGVLPQTLSVSDKKLMGGNIFMSRQNGSSSGQTVSDLDDGQDAVKLSFSKANLLYPWLQQKDQASDPSLLNGSFSLFSNDKGNCQDTVFGNNANGRDLASDSSSMMDSPNAALPVVSCNKRMDVEEIVSAPRYSTPVKPILIDKLNVVQKDLDSYVSVVPTAFNSRQLLAKEPKEVFLDGMPKNISLDTFLKTDKCLVQNNGAYPVRALDGERTIESTIASSPLSSGNSADDMLSYEEKNKTERKFCDIEESECQSDELQNASVGVKKSSPAKGGGRGTKRRRAAEVHNLSERRRRDRINQKMLALQELIPNCNKADKASMLDEAIEYLKTLKHQVHIMSMGSGYCVPPMMFQPGTQHMYHAPILHFSLMRVRMGISPSYGNTDAGSPHCPIFPAPPIQGSYFPTSPLGLMNMQGPILPMHGHPNPVHHRTLRGPHLVPLAGWHQTPTHYQVPKMFSSEDVIMNKNSHGVFNVEASRSMQCPSSQVEARTDVPSADGVKTRGAAENRGGMK